jgi:hypothetical protein
VKYQIELSDLFKIVSTLYTSKIQKYCPIILQVVDKKLQTSEFYGEEYVLQVWDSNGKLVMQRGI